ncbi:MAG TPA: PEP-CTERM sorting domain-containing protein [Verrucomicrobiae bacterium]|nr:PEP-CTERM sorting domain-containing protein [Verrucomicrobiae bacterium]
MSIRLSQGLVVLSVVGLFSIAALNAPAATYSGPGTALGSSINDGAGISSVVINNDANNITFTVNSSNPMASYIFYTAELQIVGQAANGSTSLVNPWGENIGISSGVNALVNTWGTGASALTYGGGNWTQNEAENYSAGGTGSSYFTVTFALSSLGLSVGNSFYFDVVASYANPSGQSAYGALDSTGYPAESDGSYQPWLGSNYYDSQTDPTSTFSASAPLYTVVPEPTTLVLVGLGGLLLACRRFFRRA